MADIRIEELGKSISDSLTIDEERSSRLITAFLDVARSSLSSGKEVGLEGLGTLAVGDDDGKPLPGTYAANVIGDICAKLNEPNKQAIKSALDGLAGAIRSMVLGGRRVVLDDLGTFEIRHQPPQIERQPRGHRLIRPAMTVFEFHSKKTFSSPVGAGSAVFTPDEDFRKQIEQFRMSSIMLVVPERDFFVRTLEYYFENAGWDIDVYDSIEDATKGLDSGKAYLAVIDAGMSDVQSLVTRLKMSREMNSVPLILLFPTEDSFDIVEAVTILGDENLTQPFEFRELLDCADSEILRAAEEKLIFQQQLAVHLPTDERIMEKLIESAHGLFEMSGLNEEAQVAVSAAFREAVLNAAQHGNRYRKHKKIEVQYLLDKEKLTIVVRDQGEGFEHELYVKAGKAASAVSAARQRHQQGRMGGLGILLMLRCCDYLEYNQRGNQVTLTKQLNPKE
ncbi:MAG: ATP-binding protein [Planctomycetota bacterium]|jgi:anti-sigma regulatory factor (Ser/Thr protein kinase)/nucleoid DNA-binding protein